MDFNIDLIAHRIDVFMLGLLSGGRFKGESGFAWGWAVVVGGLIPLDSRVAVACLTAATPVLSYARIRQ
ncbi:hypothetical protein [Pseudomonas prosekii]|uniref:hypothetical protein n=1 Tax=Pseudomonas prosekii TaxID=1148509 RepID=UPI003F74B29F